MAKIPILLRLINKQWNSNKTLADLFVLKEKLTLKFTWKGKATRIA